MRAKLSRIHYVLHELRRRHVIRVLGAYVFCGWVILQVAAIVFPPLLVPDWVLTVLVVLTIVGLPLVVVLTWTYDITPRGVVRTRPLPHSEMESLSINWHYVDLVIIAALISVLAFLLIKADEPTSDLPGHSIAVMPFNDLSENQANAYFSDGLSEALIDSLARIHGLRVMSRTSSFALRDRLTDVRSVADELAVDNILEGSVRKSGNRVLVSTRLVDGRHGHSLWGDTYEATLDDIFQVQENIARSIADVLQIQLMGEQVLVSVATADEDAYDHYLRGRYHLRRQATIEHVEAAIGHFESALEFDRGFTLARAGLCTAHWQRYQVTRDSGIVPEVLDICKSAELHDDQRAETHVALGSIYTGTGQYQRARTAFNRALEIDPDRSETHLGIGHLEQLTGNTRDAELHYRRAITLDPAYFRNYSFFSAFLAGQGRQEEAIKNIHTAIRLEPDSPNLYSQLGAFYVLKGDHRNATEAFEASIAIRPTGPALSNAGTLYFYSGEFAAAERMFEQAVSIDPADYRLHAHLGDTIALQSGRDPEALAHYQRSIALARQRLEINPNDHDCRAALALNLAKSEAFEQAEEELNALLDEASLSVFAHRIIGETRFLLNDLEMAFHHFEKALDLGMPPEHLASNPSLESLRDHPRFLALIENPSSMN